MESLLAVASRRRLLAVGLVLFLVLALAVPALCAMFVANSSPNAVPRNSSFASVPSPVSIRATGRASSW